MNGDLPPGMCACILSTGKPVSRSCFRQKRHCGSRSMTSSAVVRTSNPARCIRQSQRGRSQRWRCEGAPSGAVVNAIAHGHIETPRLTKQRFVAGGAAAVAVTGGVVLGIRLRFHNHAPQQLATFLTFHQQAADELGGDDLGRAGEKELGEGWENVGDGLGGYGSGLVRGC